MGRNNYHIFQANNYRKLHYRPDFMSANYNRVKLKHFLCRQSQKCLPRQQ